MMNQSTTEDGGRLFEGMRRLEKEGEAGCKADCLECRSSRQCCSSGVCALYYARPKSLRRCEGEASQRTLIALTIVSFRPGRPSCGRPRASAIYNVSRSLTSPPPRERRDGHTLGCPNEMQSKANARSKTTCRGEFCSSPEAHTAHSLKKYTLRYKLVDAGVSSQEGR